MGKRSRRRAGTPGGVAAPPAARREPAGQAAATPATKAAAKPATRTAATPATRTAAKPLPPPRRVDRRARLEEAPAAPWSPFPLVELCILVGLVLIVAAFFSTSRRGVLLTCGFGLVSAAGLELAVREHFSGYRSHSALLAGACAILAIVPLFLLTSLPQVVLLAVGTLVFAGAAWALRDAFARRAGGLGFRA